MLCICSEKALLLENDVNGKMPCLQIGFKNCISSLSFNVTVEEPHVLASSYVHGMVYVAICLKMHMMFCFMHFMLIYAMAFENAYAFELCFYLKYAVLCIWF